MKAPALFALALLCAGAYPQQRPSTPLDISNEPHHQLVLENPRVRVFSLELNSNEATEMHHHQNLYAYLSLNAGRIANEVRDRPPVMVDLEPGDVHTSKGGFTIAERNTSAEPAHLIFIEALKSDSGAFATPMGGFRFHDAAFGELFQLPAMRGYTMTIGAGGHTEKHSENYDRVVVALTNLTLREDIDGEPSRLLEMNTGDVRWFPSGMTHATTNTGKLPTTFITLEFP